MVLEKLYTKPLINKHRSPISKKTKLQSPNIHNPLINSKSKFKPHFETLVSYPQPAHKHTKTKLQNLNQGQYMQHKIISFYTHIYYTCMYTRCVCCSCTNFFSLHVLSPVWYLLFCDAFKNSRQFDLVVKPW